MVVEVREDKSCNNYERRLLDNNIQYCHKERLVLLIMLEERIVNGPVNVGVGRKLGKSHNVIFVQKRSAA